VLRERIPVLARSKHDLNMPVQKLMHCTNIFPASCRVLQALQGGTHDKILRRSVPTLHGCSVSSACLGAPFLAMMGIAHLAQGSVRGGMNRSLGPTPRLPKSHASCGRNLALDSRRGGRGMTLSCFGKSFVHVHTSPACTKRSVSDCDAWPLRADFIRNRIRDSFPSHDEHRTPRTGLSSWGEQAPRARASTASTCPHHLSGHDGGLR
jgi:hypothetical protein